MDDIPIKVENVSKVFKLPHEKHSSIKSTVVNFYRRKKSFELQKALKDVSFEVKKGEFFGIIGRNGSGKSTMLKTLAGIYAPTTGSVQINGKLTPFIELGVGFNPELSGRDNVFLNGALLGFNRKEMQAMYDDIVEFAELEKFMDQRLKNYSSGMQVRLAFSIAIRAKSDILLIDEVLAVGDINFQKKCLEIFEDLKREGRTIVFVSHSMGDVREFCDRVMVMSDGEAIFAGATEKGIDIYNRLNAESEKKRTETENSYKADQSNRFGNGKVQITDYKIYDHKMKNTVLLEAGKSFTVKLELTATEKVRNCAVGVMFRKNPQENLYGLNSFINGHPIEEIDKDEKIEVIFKEKLPLNPGSYFISLAVAKMTPSGYEDLDNINNNIKVSVTGPSLYWGVVAANPKVTIKGLNFTNRKGEIND